MRDLDKEVYKITEPSKETRKWNIAKRDTITFRGSKIKARQFIRIVNNSLPKLTKIDNGELIDHRNNLIKAYCNNGLTGMTDYEKLIWSIFKASSFLREASKLSVRAKNTLIKVFGVDDITQIDLDDFSKKPLEEMINVRGAGQKTQTEIEVLRYKFVV